VARKDEFTWLSTHEALTFLRDHPYIKRAFVAGVRISWVFLYYVYSHVGEGEEGL
jgi:hypothetical protein